MHMPWWEGGVEESGKMVISYDNLITRTWMSGAVLPFESGGIACSNTPANKEEEEGPTKISALTINGQGDENDTVTTTAANYSPNSNTTNLLNSKGLPPIPHPYWVDRLGFQQDDPVTDFRSGGVLSLAMLLHIVESCPHVHRRFINDGDASVLPYAITSINVTDMLAKLLMFSKSVEKVDALLSSKPFWRMFADPNSLLVLQELSMDVLCDVVCELRREYQAEDGKSAGHHNNSMDGSNNNNSSSRDVTVFDFHAIMERTERRVKDDLLGAGPKTVQELRDIAERLRKKNLREMERKEQIAQRKLDKQLFALSDNSIRSTTSAIRNLGGMFSKGRNSHQLGRSGSNVMSNNNSNSSSGARNYDVPTFSSTPRPPPPASDNIPQSTSGPDLLSPPSSESVPITITNNTDRNTLDNFNVGSAGEGHQIAHQQQKLTSLPSSNLPQDLLG